MTKATETSATTKAVCEPPATQCSITPTASVRWRSACSRRRALMRFATRVQPFPTSKFEMKTGEEKIDSGVSKMTETPATAEAAPYPPAALFSIRPTATALGIGFFNAAGAVSSGETAMAGGGWMYEESTVVKTVGYAVQLQGSAPPDV
ncbi:hypothetical protein PHYSODRAFT_325359 [Phytophthora sojae]|uniref:Uncharacterized protein n=1 Tax=Phytophthora sojae (strain P6497) TaxID=1094619 RepID=G4YSU7_PHYSP|nr:hypothetical protein PHYSODRAFT_325359 [Phytophthora sojae]EGZ24219.1 hypothetical protein PHYSODRAFT_325359 [Phytophthora sojae]|eukprot:XP_009519507.1 hypothetical protein PHYSODRAFT_325359 [Phytophthora sojae]